MHTPARLHSGASKMIGEQEVTSASQLMHMFTAGNHQRKVGGTKMNAESSRSHSVFSILLEVCGAVRHAGAFGIMVSSRIMKPSVKFPSGMDGPVDNPPLCLRRAQRFLSRDLSRECGCLGSEFLWLSNQQVHGLNWRSEKEGKRSWPGVPQDIPPIPNLPRNAKCFASMFNTTAF